VTDHRSEEPVGTPTLAFLEVAAVHAVAGEPVCCVCGRRGTLIDPYTG
jgi:hypothetical protein